ncbi:MAG: TraB/GumN family protein [Nanoarchaeota archaeon]
MRYKNLILIGSSHVSKDSVNLVKSTIETEKPGIIAIELDKDRLNALLNSKKHSYWIKGIGIKGMLFALFGAWIEKKIGQIVKVKPGSEMKMAINLARKHNLKLALIDQHIIITLRRFSQTITWKEKRNFVVDLISGIIMPKRQMKKFNLSNNDLTKVPDSKTISKILEFTKKRYPNFYNVLVHERNIVMANNIAHLMKENSDEKIVAVVGAGHQEEMMKMIKKL